MAAPFVTIGHFNQSLDEFLNVMRAARWGHTVAFAPARDGDRHAPLLEPSPS